MNEFCDAPRWRCIVERMRAYFVATLAILVACGGNSTGDDDDDGIDGGTQVTVTLTNQPTDAAQVSFIAAYQDGDGAWMLAPAPSGNTYSFSVAGATYSFAWTCIASGPLLGAAQIRQVQIARFAVSERPNLSLTLPPRCAGLAGTVPLTGTVSNLGTSGNFFVTFGDRFGIVNPNTGAFMMMTPPGTHDLLVLRMQSGVGPGERVVDRAFIQRGLAVSGATTANVDFSTSMATMAYPVTITDTGRIGAMTTLFTPGGTEAGLVQLYTTPYESRALASAQAMAGDLYEQEMSVNANGQTATTTLTTTAPAAQTWTAPPPLGGVIATIASAAPYAQVSSMWPAYANAVGYSWQASQQLTMAQCGGNTGCVVLWQALVSPGAAGASPMFTMPDLSALAGWSATLQPIAGVEITGFAQAVTSSAGAADFPPATPPADGTQRTVVRSDYTVMP